MAEPSANQVYSPSTKASYVRFFMAVFVLITFTAVVIAFIVPEQFLSRTRIKIQQASNQDGLDPSTLRAESEIVKSQPVLSRVVTQLQLAEKWGEKFGRGEKLSTQRVIAALRQKLKLEGVVNTPLVDIMVFDQDPAEAALLANAIAESYIQERRQTAGLASEIMDLAVPSLRPARPNKPLIISLGVVLGLAAAGGLIFLTRIVEKRVLERQAAAPAVA